MSTLPSLPRFCYKYDVNGDKLYYEYDIKSSAYVRVSVKKIEKIQPLSQIYIIDINTVTKIKLNEQVRLLQIKRERLLNEAAKISAEINMILHNSDTLIKSEIDVQTQRMKRNINNINNTNNTNNINNNKTSEEILMQQTPLSTPSTSSPIQEESSAYNNQLPPTYTAAVEESSSKNESPSNQQTPYNEYPKAHVKKEFINRQQPQQFAKSTPKPPPVQPPPYFSHFNYFSNDAFFDGVPEKILNFKNQQYQDLLTKYGIFNKRDWKKWLVKNHSDKNPNTDLVLLAKINEAVTELSKAGIYV